jgi:hypothetical protein
MDESLPVVCSLGADDLRRRLEEIAALGRESLTGRDADAETQTLRFRRGPATRGRLEGIVAAESDCCPFLEFDLGEEGDELVLKIGAPQEGAAVAAELARAFGEPD